MLGQVWSILSPTERRRYLLLQPLVVFTALLETAGLASIVPFLALLSDAEAVSRHRVLSLAYDGLGFASTTTFFFVVGLAVLFLVTISNVVNALTTWALLRFSWMGIHSLGVRLLESYLGRPYAYFLEHNSSELGKNILAEVNQVVSGVLVALTHMLSRVMVLCSILILLLMLDPLMALGTGGAFGFVYGGMYALVRNRLRHDGRVRNEANGKRHKLVHEALGGIKELKLYGLEGEAAAAYGIPSKLMADAQARASVLAQIPRYALETIAFGGVLLLVLGLLWRGQGLTEALPVLGLYAFSAYRMLPGLQAIFNGLTSLRYSLSALETLHRDLHTERTAPSPEATAVSFEQSITLYDVAFGYSRARGLALTGVSLSIQKGQWVALVGPTGAGKSTLVDVLLGLLVPDSGHVTVDSMPLVGGAARGWQQRVAYVPQQIFLLDDTVTRNICFGVPPEQIDQMRLVQAARIAQIDSFIERELPKAYDTPIGERGVRLSGGQRQRIGIARALYRRPDFLVLDEATSALDSATEAAFFTALRAELAHVSVVSIAHRLSTTRDFDRIMVLEQGRVVDSGTYRELEVRSVHFQSAGASLSSSGGDP